MFGEGGSLSTALGIHEVTSSDMPGFRMMIGESVIDVNFAPGVLETPLAAVHHWISASACAVTMYYGRFPVKHLHLLIVPVEGQRGVLNGRTQSYGGASTTVFVGQFANEADLKRDWVMTHEMVHLAFPSVADEHHWIEEGLATYVEPIARVEAGNLEPRSVWHDLVEGLPKGLPQAGDKGLDYTHTWGRTYWGGALFCTLADVEIRQRTNNRRGLQDALRAILAAGGSMEVSWPLERALMVGEKATGVPVLTELYQQMKAKAVQYDLAGLWNKLGVEPLAEVSFNDRAPLAAVRRAITAVPAGATSCSPTFDNSVSRPDLQSSATDVSVIAELFRNKPKLPAVHIYRLVQPKRPSPTACRMTQSGANSSLAILAILAGKTGVVRRFFTPLGLEIEEHRN
jgi:hypothetical protein